MKHLLLLFFLVTPSMSADYDPLVHHERVYKSLALWGGVSMAAGGAMLFHENREIRTIGIQNILWGGVNEGIAILSLRRTMPKVRTMDPEEARRRLRKVMFINGLLDVLYIGAGVALFNSLDDDEIWKWRGLGFTIQGGYLLGFDWLNFSFTYRS